MPETSIVPLVQLWRKYAEFAPSTGREPGPAEPPTLVDQYVAWLVHFSNRRLTSRGLFNFGN
jgi:hypothetical protein